MANGKNQHVVKHQSGDWSIKGAGNSKATKVVETQKEAIKIAREISVNQGSELIVHGRDGKIRSRDSHGKDNYPPKG